MRFCQTDGTPLVEEEAPLDPYKTMMARPGDLADASPKSQNKEEEEVLQLPAEKPDLLKTTYTSEDEIRRAMASRESDKEQVIELPPLAPDPPKFNEPSLIPPSFDDISPPPSPKEAYAEKSPFNSSPPLSPFEMTTPPVPSPFGESNRASYNPPARNFQEHAKPEPPGNVSPPFNPFDKPSPPAEWAPSPAPRANWQNQGMAQNAPSRPPMARTEGPNQVLAIVSLVLGIIGLVFCMGVTSPIALVTGFLARRKAAEKPSEYGGGGLALAGIITGAIGTILLLFVVLYIVFVFGVVGISLLGS